MQITALFLVKIIMIVAILSYVAGIFCHFMREGYTVLNTAIQAALHLFFCMYTLFGWISLLLNTPGLALEPLIIIGFFWLISCRLLYTVLDYIRGAIPRKSGDEQIG